MNNVSRFMQLIMSNNRDFRKTAMTNIVKGLTIDTVYAPDVKCWETAIGKNVEWIIVEEYINKTFAEKGHNDWVRKIRNNPKLKLISCRRAFRWFLG